jgi:hypothetical protein
MNVTINNQCSNVDLTSPLHFTKDAMCYRHIPLQVGSKSTMRANFKTDVNRDTFGGVLLYHLQRKEYSESGARFDAVAASIKDVSITTQFLVIWEFRIDRLYSYAWVVEHESTVVWDEDTLEELYNTYDSRYDTDIIFNIGRWLLDDNTRLQTVCVKYYMKEILR